MPLISVVTASGAWKGKTLCETVVQVQGKTLCETVVQVKGIGSRQVKQDEDEDEDEVRRCYRGREADRYQDADSAGGRHSPHSLAGADPCRLSSNGR